MKYTLYKSYAKMDIWLTVSDTRNVWSKSILPTQKYYLFLDFMA